MPQNLIPLYARTDCKKVRSHRKDVEEVWKYNNGFPKELLTENNFIKHHDARNNMGLPGLDFELVYKTYDPETDEKYFYPILISLQAEYERYSQIEIESNVLEDVRAGKCYILISNVFEGWGWDYWNAIAIFLMKKYNLTEENFVMLTGNLAENERFKTVYFNNWERTVIHQNPEIAFNDSRRNILEQRQRKNAFICLNRRPHPHRFALVTLLHNLEGKGITTFAREADSSEGHYQNQKNIFKDKYPKIARYFDKWNLEERFPLTIDDGLNPKVDNPVHDKMTYKFHDSYLHILAETFGDDAKGRMFFSEKIFKPVLYFQPFVIIGQSGSLAAFRKLGYKTFDPIIDESYDTVIDNQERIIQAYGAIKKFCDRSLYQIHKDYERMEEIYFYNFGHLMKRMCTLDLELKKELQEILK